MARPLRNNIMYFSHDANAWRNFKFQALRAHYPGEKGWAMEARFWALNCLIGESEGCRLDLRRALFKADIARKLDISLEELNEFIHFLADPEACDLINNQDGVIWTDRCDEELGRVMKKREGDRERKPSFPSGTVPDNEVSDTDSTRKTELSGTLKPDSGQQSLLEPIGAEGIGAENSSALPAASFVSLMKKELAASGRVLSSADLDGCASKLIASSLVTTEAHLLSFVAWALKKCAKEKQAGTWFVKGILEWGWIEKWAIQCVNKDSVPARSGRELDAEHEAAEDARILAESADPDAQLEARRALARLHTKQHQLTAEDRELLGLPIVAAGAAPIDTFEDDLLPAVAEFPEEATS